MFTFKLYPLKDSLFYIFLQNMEMECDHAVFMHAMRTCLPSQVKTQYLQVKNIVDTSIKHQISGQSTAVIKGSMYICLMW